MSSAKFVKEVLEKKKTEVERLSDQIFDLAETGFHEFQTVRLYEEALRKEGFEVECGWLECRRHFALPMVRESRR